MELTSESYQSQNSKVINKKQKQHASQPLYIYVYKLREKEFFALNHHKGMNLEVGYKIEWKLIMMNSTRLSIFVILCVWLARTTWLGLASSN